MSALYLSKADQPGASSKTPPLRSGHRQLLSRTLTAPILGTPGVVVADDLSQKRYGPTPSRCLFLLQPAKLGPVPRCDVQHGCSDAICVVLCLVSLLIGSGPHAVQSPTTIRWLWRSCLFSIFAFFTFFWCLTAFGLKDEACVIVDASSYAQLRGPHSEK
jgi:hypothetical protein